MRTSKLLVLTLGVGIVSTLSSHLFSQDDKKVGPPVVRANKAKLVLAEYCQRAAKVAPLDADAHFQLGQWCSTNGLASKATASFNEAIRIDSDHAAARAALGFTRYGSRWSKGAPKRAQPIPADSSEDSPRSVR